MPIELEARFATFEPFAAGATGTLWRGRDDAVNVTVALKLLSAAQSNTAADRARVRRELRKQLTIEHTHLPQVYDEGEVSGRLWFAREYVPGDTLALRLRREGAMPVKDALAIIAQLASALDALHRQGLSHRDLKPGHVVLRKIAGREVVQLFDCGVVSAEDRVGVVYAAPELTGDTRVPANFRSDLYALGCLGYELLTGTAPFPEVAAESVLQAPKTHHPAVFANDFPAPLRTLLASLLAKDPRRRPFSAQQVRRALDPYLPAWVPAAPAISHVSAAPTPSIPVMASDSRHAQDTGSAPLFDEANMPSVPNMPSELRERVSTPAPQVSRPAPPSDATVELGPAELDFAILAAEGGKDQPDPTQELDLLDIEPVSNGGTKTDARKRAVAGFAAQAIARVRQGLGSKKDSVAPAAAAELAEAPAPAQAVADDDDDDDDAPTIALSLASRAALSGFASGAREVRESTPAEPVPAVVADHDDEEQKVTQLRHQAAPEAITATSEGPAPIAQTDSAPHEAITANAETPPSEHAGPDTEQRAAYEDELERAFSRSSFTSLSDSGLPDDMRAELRSSHRPPFTQSPNLVLLGAVALVAIAVGVRVVRGPGPDREEQPLAVAAGPALAVEAAQVQDHAAPALVGAEAERAPQPTAAEPRAAEAPPPPAAAEAVPPTAAVVEPSRGRGPAVTQTMSAAEASRGVTRAETKPLADSDFKGKARVFYQEGKFREAAEAYQAAASRSADDASAFAGLGASWLGAGDAERAVAAYERAVQLKPGVSGFQAALGRAYLAKGDRVRAQSAYARALELDPANQAARSGVLALQLK